MTNRLKIALVIWMGLMTGLILLVILAVRHLNENLNVLYYNQQIMRDQINQNNSGYNFHIQLTPQHDQVN
ncbi:MAG: Ac45/VOA1 transmembrane domain-containing protein [Minisyncoccia bacterium]